MDIKSEGKIIKKNTTFTMLINTFLAIIKMIGGILGHSNVLVSDAINSIGDILTNLVVYISSFFSKKGEDKDHPYGYEKYDSVISIFLGIGLIYSAYEIAKFAVLNLYGSIFNNLVIKLPAWYTIIILLGTILIKAFLYSKTKKDALAAKSSALLAQAWDHKSDTFASLGALIGIVGIYLGFQFLEPIASIVIAFFISRLGYKIIVSGISQVVDKAADDIVNEQIKAIVLKHSEVRSLDLIKTRLFGMKLYVDLEIGLDYDLSLEESHNIAERIHEEVEKQLSDVIHCMIHVNPSYIKNNRKN